MASRHPSQLIAAFRRGSVFGPVGFISYIEDVADLMDRHGVRSHMYADDTYQFHDSCRPSDVDSLRSRLSHCASDTDVWCRCRRLLLNANKTEAIWFGSKSDLTKLSTANMSVQAGSATIQPSMKHHVPNVAAVCFYHLRRLRQIRRRKLQYG